MHELNVFADCAGTLPSKLCQDPVRLQPCRPRRLASGGKVTAPRPRFEPLDHLGAQRIEDNIARQFEQLAVTLNQDSLVPALENMPYPSMRTVKALGVDAIELAHALRKVGFRCLNQDVVVVRHHLTPVLRDPGLDGLDGLELNSASQLAPAPLS